MAKNIKQKEASDQKRQARNNAQSWREQAKKQGMVARSYYLPKETADILKRASQMAGMPVGYYIDRLLKQSDDKCIRFILELQKDDDPFADLLEIDPNDPFSTL